MTTRQCHVTLDHHISHVVGIAAWCHRLSLISKVSPDRDIIDAQERLAIGTAGQEYFWTGDTTRLQALVPPREGG